MNRIPLAAALAVFGLAVLPPLLSADAPAQDDPARPVRRAITVFNNGDRFEGNFQNFIQSGPGTYLFAEGDRYDGDFKEGRLEGRGVYTFADGTRYVGDLRDNQFHGQGTVLLANGDRLVGQFREGRSHGFGIRAWVDGERYEGRFSDGRFEGYGRYYFVTGDRYEGEFRDDLRHGRGIYLFANGDRFEGRYRYDQRDGHGVYLFANGGRFEGEFRAGEVISGAYLAGSCGAAQQLSPQNSYWLVGHFGREPSFRRPGDYHDHGRRLGHSNHQPGRPGLKPVPLPPAPAGPWPWLKNSSVGKEVQKPGPGRLVPLAGPAPGGGQPALISPARPETTPAGRPGGGFHRR